MFRGLLRTQTARSAVRVTRPAFVQPAAPLRVGSSIRFYSEEAKKEETKEEAKEETTTESEQPKDDLTVCREELEAAKKETAKYKDTYLRSVADFRNLQESTKREIQKKTDLALKKFAGDLLEVVDTFEIALKTLENEEGSDVAKKAGELDDLIKGVQLTQSMFLNTLKRHGMTQIEALGEKFDPNVHEATFEVPQPDKEAGTVFFVQQPGYYLNGRVLRPAKVGVVKGSD